VYLSTDIPAPHFVRSPKEFVEGGRIFFSQPAEYFLAA
jgi:hypothetical protein